MPAANDEHLMDPLLDRIEKLLQREVDRIDAYIISGFKQLRTEAEAEHRWVIEQMDLRAKHQSDLAVAEAKRIDDKWEAQAVALGLANTQADRRAEALAATVEKTAENLRSQGTLADTKVTQQLNQVTGPLAVRVQALEQARSESHGMGGGLEKALGWLFAGIMALAAIGMYFRGGK
jgi:hypothetical protein